MLGRWIACTGVLALLVVACTAGDGAKAVRPKAPSASAATGRGECTPGSAGSATPLVVDWQAETRGDLESAMGQRIAVVAYSCDAIRFLEDCYLDATYTYTPISLKEDVLRLTGADELRAELPFSGMKLAGSLAGELERGMTLDIAIAIAGKKRATIQAANRAELRGNCDGATHFVRSATLGAFAVSEGTRAQVRTTAEIFGSGASVGSRNARTIERHDGSLEVCRAPGAVATPREGCAAVVRVELASIDAAPAGMRFAGAEAREKTKACTFGDPVDCPKKCESGVMAACFWLGRMYQDGKGVTKDPARALELFDRTCASGEGRGCFARAVDLMTGQSGRRDLPRASALLERGCMLGEDQACTLFGIDRLRTDFPKAESVLTKACEHGEQIACTSLGGAYFDHGDRGRAQQLLDRGCTLGHAEGCTRAAWLRRGGTGEMPVK